MDRLVRKIKKEKKNVKGHKRHCLKLLCKPQAVIEMCLLSRHVITWKEVQPKPHVCHVMKSTSSVVPSKRIIIVFQTALSKNTIQRSV